MEKGDTPVTSLAFNAIIVLIGAITVTHFCTDAFSAYAENTDAARLSLLHLPTAVVMMMKRKNMVLCAQRSLWRASTR